MNAKLFRDSLFSKSKIRSAHHKNNDFTTAFVSTIAPADAISLRCNHSTRHLKCEPRRRETMKFAPAKKIRDFGCPNPSPASIFSKISSFRNFGVMHQPCLATYNFFVSQRLAVILSENQIQTYCSCMISTLVRNSTFSIAKIRAEDGRVTVLYKLIRVSNCPC